MKKLLLLLLLASCRPCLQPEFVMQEQFSEQERIDEMEGAKVDLATWWEQFQDPLLTQLIQKALDQNLTLRIARERICQARAQFGVEFSRLLPQIDAEAFFLRERNPSTEGDSPFLGGGFENFYRVGFDAAWELDIFGKLRDRARGAALDVLSEEELLRHTNLTITSEIALNYFLIRNLQDRIRITQLHIGSAADLVATTNTRYDIGLIPEIDVYTARALLRTRYADLADLQARLKETIFAIATLLGQMPNSMLYAFDQPRAYEIHEADIPVGLPSELLCRRGDVRAAELSLLASGARVKASRKELFPTLSLEGLFKYSTSFFSFWFKPESRFWQIQPVASMPIFRGGQILSQIAVATSLQHQAAIQYEKTVLDAVEEVESSLVAYFQEHIRVDELIEQTKNYEHARTLADSLYSAGLVNFLFLFELERELYASQIAESEGRELLRAKLVAIFKALGGGWEC
ncbi:MAG: Toluene efflux pump outer membrane protein TtgI [Chlamydiales bacterium]|nr:Toluene efflux pump outer membrane protein TtgI [Chlamydiales bacterium]MCH9636203.1 Toluene efflux pump outer membrane protein TtgI [Chlamydiales bacterium]MCH9703356.1 efflux transporter outer membrane subunit [Chlamydiota bacterium]